MKTREITPLNAFLMMVLITFWGSSFVVVKIALREGLTPISIATFRFLIAGGLFQALMFVGKNLGHKYTTPGLKDFPKMMFLSLSGVTFFFAAQYTGIQMAGATIASILVCLLSPIFITVLSIVLFGDKLNKRQYVGVGVAAIGTFTVIAGSALGIQGNEQFVLGGLVLLSTPILWTGYTLLGKKVMKKYHPLVVVAWVTSVGGLFLFPISVVENSLQQLFTMNLASWLAILYLSITCTLLGYYIWLHVLKQVKAAVTSAFLFAEPLVTGMLAIASVGEKITVFIFAGGVLVLLGVYLVTQAHTNKHKSA